MSTILDDLRHAVTIDDRTQAAIALEAGIHPKTFSAFMNGRRGLSIETVEQLAKALHLRLALIRARESRS